MTANPHPEQTNVILDARRPWSAPKLSALDASSTETFKTKSYEIDNHRITSNYGTPPS